MDDAHGFLQTLAVVLCVAAVTTVLFQRLKQPVVLGYLLAGMVVGPVHSDPDSSRIAYGRGAGRAGRHPADVLARDRIQPDEAASRRERRPGSWPSCNAA